MRTFLFFGAILFAGSIFGQKTSTNTAKMDFVQFPTVPVQGMNNLGIQVYTADLPFNKDTLRLYLGNMDGMKSNIERMSKVDYNGLQEISIVGGEGDITIDMAFGMPVVVSKEVKKSSCMVAKDGCVQYYYKVKYRLPAVVQARNATGILNTWELDPNMELQFGNEQVEKHTSTEVGSVTSIQVVNYTSEEDLAMAFSAYGEAAMARKGIVTQLGNMAESIYKYVFFEETTLKLDIAYGKGSAADYTETEAAADNAVEALESDDYAALQAPILVWETWLEKYNPDDKKAAVNNEVAQGLHENLSIAYTFTGQFAKAHAHIDEALALAQKGHVNENEVKRLKEFRLFIDQQAKAKEYNGNLSPTNFVTAPDIKKILGRREYNEALNFLIAEDKYSTISKNNMANGSKKDLSEMTVEEAMSLPLDESSNSSSASEEANIDGRVENNMLILSGIVDGNMRGKAFPSSICEYTDIKTIRAVNIGFTSFPDCIGVLVNLEKLLISSNSFTELPDAFGSLQKLEVLDISNNNLKTIPPSIFTLTSLEKITVSGNQFSDADMKKLHETFPDAKIK